MTAADDYPYLVRSGRSQNRTSADARNALVEIDHLRAEVARLKDQLANEREAADLTIQHVRTGGRIT